MTADSPKHTKTATDVPSRGAASGVEVHTPTSDRASEILSPEAVAFVAALHRKFNPTREALLAKRAERQATFDAGRLPDFLPETRAIREGSWRVAPVPRDLRDRRVEITGPVDRKMVINALNSGASTYMADFEDANSPTWENLIAGHVNLVDAIRKTITFTTPDGRTYRLAEKTATLIVRPRGWHLLETHMRVDGRPVCLQQRAGIARTGYGAVLLSSQAAEPSRSSSVERRLLVRRGCLGDHPSEHEGHGPRRAHPCGVRNGRDPLRAERPLRGAECRTVGLHLQHHQDIPEPAGVCPA